MGDPFKFIFLFGFNHLKSFHFRNLMEGSRNFEILTDTCFKKRGKIFASKFA